MQNNPKILCVIPARGGSKGVKRKNIRSFNGQPLISWTIQAAKRSKFINRVIVSTEDKEIESVSLCYGAEVVQRPMELAQDDSSTMDSLLYTLDELRRTKYIPDYIVLLQCTSPLRTKEHIDEAIKNFLCNINHFDSLISVVKEEHPPWWLQTIDDTGLMKKFINYDQVKYVRRQDFPSVYRFNGAIYIIKTDIFYKYKTFDTPRTLGYEMDVLSSIDIDTEMDFNIAEYIANIETGGDKSD